MTENVAPRRGFGQQLGETHRQVGKLFDQSVTEYDLDLPTWMLCVLLRQQTTALAIDDVLRELAQRVDLPEGDARKTIQHAETAGYVRRNSVDGTTMIEMTEEGTARFAKVFTSARAATDAAIEGIEPDALETAYTVLQDIEKSAIGLLG
ncbi:MarR family winged helix-turn-helix transcriptional regulator [Nocardia sp. NPDC020380]|uniref:MarR family winged helix-turn-helix transcriptional regulator n=1 Tax=Nocardia sp. NPDC020380 TaxID=3364309 RepID=UPI00379C2912